MFKNYKFTYNIKEDYLHTNFKLYKNNFKIFE